MISNGPDVVDIDVSTGNVIDTLQRWFQKNQITKKNNEPLESYYS